MISRSDRDRYTRTNLPVVVVRRRRRDSPHIAHNGAWKVAYSDFVTAMMSFFLLLWLLSVTTSVQREAISNYFEPSAASPGKSGSGGVLGGKSVIEPGQLVSPDAETGVHVPFPGSPDTSRRHDEQNDPGDGGKRGDAAADSAGKIAGNPASAKQAAEQEDLRFKEAEAALRQAIQSVPEMQALARNLIVDETPEGLRIQIVDQDGATMFPLGSSGHVRSHAQKRSPLSNSRSATCPTRSRSAAIPTRRRIVAARTISTIGTCRRSAPTHPAARWRPPASAPTA